MNDFVYKDHSDLVGVRRGGMLCVAVRQEPGKPPELEMECECGAHFMTSINGFRTAAKGCPECRRRRAREASALRRKCGRTEKRTPAHRGNDKWKAIPVGRDLTEAELMDIFPRSKSGWD